MRENAPVLFFFSRRILALNSDPKCLLRDCLFQALGYSAILPVELQPLMARFPDVEQVPFKDLSAVLTAILPRFPKIYLVFDAMDELTADQGIVLDLLRLGQLKPSSVKVAITSRHAPPGGQPNHISLLDLQLAKSMIGKDISSYINHRMGLQGEGQMSSDDRSAIQDALSQKSQSLFLYARLMLDKVLQSGDPIHDQLDRLPGSLVDMYTDILNEHSVLSKISREFQVSLLSWITHSSRALRLTELAIVVNSDPNRWGQADTRDAKLMIRSACGPLVEILEDETVQVIHHSFTEFLLDDGRVSSSKSFPSLISSDVHRNLTITCVDYLLSGCFDSWSLMTAEEEDDDHKISEERRALMIRFPFLQYTYQNWPYHAARCDKLDTGLFETLDSLLKYGAHPFESWKAFWFSTEDIFPKEFYPLHVAAQSGLVSYTSYLLDKGDDADRADSYGRSPLAHAAIGGHSKTAAVLINRTTSVSTKDFDGLAPIHHASKGNHSEVVKGLLTAGADPMEPKSREDRSWASWSLSTNGKTPMQYACELGNTEAVDALALYMNPRQRDDIHLHWAASKGQANVLSVLLKHPEIEANINRKDEKGNTALYVAACYRNSATVRILLDHGADVRITSRNGSDDHEFTPLQGWARLQDQKMYDRTPRIPTGDMGNVLRLLVQAGCDINARCYDGETPLFAYEDQSLLGERHSKPAVEFVSLLLKHGADPRATDNRGNTVLHKASWCRERKQVVELFVKAGADINAINHEGLTPLITMAKQQIFDIRSFVDNGADVNKQDPDGNTALHHICTSWCLEREHIEEWLAYADPTIKNYDGNTCVYNLRWGNGGQGRVEGIKLMVDKGLDLESKNIRGRTALLAACENVQHHFAHELLRLGADATVRDFQNKSCFHLFISGIDWYGSSKKTLDTVQSLVQAGVDINAVDYGGNTPFHDAVVENAVKKKLTTIIEIGGVANKRNNLGRTALHMAAGLESDNQSISRINFLLKPDLGIDIHQKDHEGLTAIHLAASVAPTHVCHLISVGADVRAEGFDGRTPLHCAAASGESNVVGLLCELYRNHSWDIDPKDSRGCTPLHEAARSGSAECVYLLLQSGADPTAKNKYGQAPLHTAAEHRVDTLDLRNKRKNELLSGWDNRRGGSRFTPDMDPDRVYGSKTSLGLGIVIAQEEETHMIQNVIRLLLSAGADPTVRDKFRQTPYEVAVMLGCEGAVDVLAPHRHNVTSGTNALPPNPLADQLYLSRTRNVEDMVKQISPEDIKTHSILSTAIYLKNENLLGALLKAGADPTATDTEGLTAIHKVAYWGLTSMMKIMASYVEDLNKLSPPLLHVAALRDLSNIQMVNLLIKLGVDLNVMHHEEKGDQYADDRRPKFYAAIHIFAAGKKWWHIPALRSLCEAGADIELSDRDGNTPLLCALSGHWNGKIGTWSTDSYTAGFWRDQSLEVLLEHGANINALSSKGESTLTTAVTWKRGPKLIRKLLDYGADMSLGNVPVLFTVVDSHDVEATKLILEAGADPNTMYEPVSRKRRRYGVALEVETPLLAASWVESRDAPGSKKALAKSSLIALLLEYGADPMMKFADGQNTLHKIAYCFGFFGPLLTAAGVDFEAKDNDGRTPLLLACRETFYTSTRRDLVSDTVKELVLGGVNVNATDNKGLTALNLTAQNGSAETISLLISHGASISAADNNGLTPLYYSLAGCFGLRKIQALLSAGADPLCTGPKGETALHLLAPCLMIHSPADQMEGTGCTDKTNYMAGYTELYHRFIDGGCDPNGRDREGNTPLFPYLARVKERSDMIFVPPPDMGDVKRMLDLHDVFAVNIVGDTLLHVVAGRFYEPTYDDYDDGASDGDAVLLFKELLKRGLDPRKENKAGLSALDVATTYGKEAVLKLFERRDYQVE
ncbi:hypothetical protein AWENTII_009490 [Aspergillus wentii]